MLQPLRIHLMDNLSIPVRVPCVCVCVCVQLLKVEEAARWVYRDVLPIPIWVRFLMRWPSGIYLPGIVRGCYLTIKLTGLLDKVHVVRSAVEALVLQQTPIIKRPKILIFHKSQREDQVFSKNVIKD